MAILARSRRLVVAGALMVLGVAVSFLALATVRDAVALSIALVLIVGGLATITTPGLRATHPVLVRATMCTTAVVAALVATFYFSESTNYNLATGAAMSIVLVGLSFLTGASGQISLGNGAFMGVGAFVMAIWANHHATTPIVVTLVIAVLCGALVGFLLGLPATRLRGPYLAGMTLAFALAFGAILSSFNSWTGGDGGLQLPSAATPPTWLVSLFGRATPSLTTNTAWLTDITLVVTGVAFFFMANLFASRTGRGMRLIRDNDVAAELVGISLPRARVIAFIVSSAYAALGGALFTLINNSVSPSTYSFALSITILSVVVIGGIGTIPGALIGGLIYAYSSNVISWIVSSTGLNAQGNLASQLNGIIFGGLLIVTMLFAPLGVAGSVRHLWHRRRHRSAP
ncbi:MAG: branched-chain amino acid ABC transporter permease [Acidimicrobiales bacterium]